MASPDDDLSDVVNVATPPEGDEGNHPVKREDVARARRVKALQWRMMGLSYADIAERLEVNVATAASLVDSALSGAEHAVSESVHQLRAVENRRLERLQATFWPSALKGDQKSFDNLMKLHDRRVRLNGLEAPVQINLSLAVRTEMEEALAELDAALLGDVVDAELVEETPALESSQ